MNKIKIAIEFITIVVASISAIFLTIAIVVVGPIYLINRSECNSYPGNTKMIGLECMVQADNKYVTLDTYIKYVPKIKILVNSKNKLNNTLDNR